MTGCFKMPASSQDLEQLELIVQEVAANIKTLHPEDEKADELLKRSIEAKINDSRLVNGDQVKVMIKSALKIAAPVAQATGYGSIYTWGAGIITMLLGGGEVARRRKNSSIDIEKKIIGTMQPEEYERQEKIRGVKPGNF